MHDIVDRFLQTFEETYIQDGGLRTSVSPWIFQHYHALLRASINGQCLCDALVNIHLERPDDDITPHASLMHDYITVMYQVRDECICQSHLTLSI